MTKKYEVAVNLPQDFTVEEQSQGRNNIGAASASDVTALQSQVSSLSNVSAYSVKGEATVAQLNAGPSGIQAGWAYQLTDSGTLTDGSLAVVAGDTVAWDGTKWFPLVKSDYYATKTYAQNVAHSLAPAFDPARDSEHAYPAGYSVTYTDGKVYTFKVSHYGPWTGTDVDEYVASEDGRRLAGFIKIPIAIGDCESGKYIKANGSTADDANYVATPFIPVSGNELCCWCTLGAYRLAAFYDANKNFVSSFNGSNAQTSESKLWSIHIPVGAVYFRASIASALFASRQVYAESFTLSNIELDELEKSNLIVEKSITLDSTTLTTGKYINGSSGAVGDRTGYAVSDYIDISDVMPGFSVLSYASMLQYMGVAFYDVDKTYISGWHGNNISDVGSNLTGDKWRVLPTPSNAMYMRISVPSAFTTSVVLKYITGANVRSEFPVIKDNFDKLFGVVGVEVTLASCESGKYIKANGSTADDANYVATPFIPVSGSRIDFFASLSAYRLAVFYDINKNFVSNINTGTPSAVSKDYSATIPAGAVYFRASIKSEDLSSSKKYVCLTNGSSELDGFETNEITNKKSVSLDSSTLSLDKYVAGDSGFIGDRTGYAASDYIDISDLMPGFPILSYASMLQYMGVAFYSASKTYISGWYGNNISSLGSGLTGDKWRVLPVPIDAVYVRVSVPKTFTTSVVLKYVSSPNVRAASNAVSALELIDNPLEDMIANAVCIGDSLTIGADYTSGDYTGNMATNYPYFLEKLTGMNVAPSNTAAFAGDTAVDCYGRFFSGAGAIDVTAYDAFVIWLGTNGGYTDTLQEDVLDHGTDYASYANTATGCLCKIISTIIASNPTAKIFLGNVFTTSGDKSITNSVIQQIAALTMYKDNIVGVVNNDDGSLYNNHPEYHPGNVLHFGKVGNYFLAKHWRDEIRRLINLNVTLMEYPRVT